jgi:uncharacterized membrane protein YfcA
VTKFAVFAGIASLGMLVQSTVGFAGSLVAIPLFALFMSPREAGPPVVVYALSREWPKDTFRNSLLAYLLCLAATAAVSYTSLGMVNSHLLSLSATGLLPALAARHLGVWPKGRINESTFRLVVFITVIAVGVIRLMKYLQ